MEKPYSDLWCHTSREEDNGHEKLVRATSHPVGLDSSRDSSFFVGGLQSPTDSDPQQ
jgi:hypothetical protein